MNACRSVASAETMCRPRLPLHLSACTVRAMTAACVLAVACMSVAHARPKADEDATVTVISTLAPNELRDVMKAEGYEASLDKDGNVMWKVEGFKAHIFVSDDGQSIQFHSSFRDGTATLKKVNEWNRTRRYSRTYLDDDGDPHLELDLDMEGGVTLDRLIDFLKTCRVSFDAWCKEVVK
jgi:hypothetical protein